MKILVINGPNLNMLGKREPEIYGTQTLTDIENMITERAAGHTVYFFQSNHEGAIIDTVQEFDGDAIIINAGAYTHYSYAIADALKMRKVKKVEVHMSDITKREPFRAVSVLTAVCDKCIYGHGAKSYILALDYVLGK